MTFSLIAPFFGRNALLWIVDMSSIGATIAFGYTSYIAFKIARQKDNKWICCTGFFGMIFSTMFIYILLVPINDKAMLGVESYIGLLIWSLLGILMYLYTKFKKSNHRNI